MVMVVLVEDMEISVKDVEVSVSDDKVSEIVLLNSVVVLKVALFEVFGCVVNCWETVVAASASELGSMLTVVGSGKICEN
jgi:hypothetical protein